jgi:hypothetical protein
VSVRRAQRTPRRRRGISRRIAIHMSSLQAEGADPTVFTLCEATLSLVSPSLTKLLSRHTCEPAVSRLAFNWSIRRRARVLTPPSPVASREAGATTRSPSVHAGKPAEEGPGVDSGFVPRLCKEMKFVGKLVGEISPDRTVGEPFRPLVEVSGIDEFDSAEPRQRRRSHGRAV